MVSGETRRHNSNETNAPWLNESRRKMEVVRGKRRERIVWDEGSAGSEVFPL